MLGIFLIIDNGILINRSSICKLKRSGQKGHIVLAWMRRPDLFGDENIWLVYCALIVHNC